MKIQITDEMVRMAHAASPVEYAAEFEETATRKMLEAALATLAIGCDHVWGALTHPSNPFGPGSAYCLKCNAQPNGRVNTDPVHGPSPFSHAVMPPAHPQFLPVGDPSFSHGWPASGGSAAAMSAGAEARVVAPTPRVKLGAPMLQALSRMAERRHSDGTSSVVSAEDRSLIIETCYSLMTGADAQLQDATSLADDIEKLDIEYDVGEFYGLSDWAAFVAGVAKGRAAAAELVRAKAPRMPEGA